MYPKPEQGVQEVEAGSDSNSEMSAVMIEYVIRALATQGIFAFRWEQACLPVLHGNWDSAEVQ